MKIKLVNILLSVGTAIGLYACGSGSGGDNSGVSPSPSPAEGTYLYNGEAILYSDLPQPNNTNGGVLQYQYPSGYLPNSLSNSSSLQIAYGSNTDSNVQYIAALVKIGGGICSATPVKYDEFSNSTFLIGAAHCFVNNKNNPTSLSSGNLYSLSQLRVYQGTNYNKGNGDMGNGFPVKAIYIQNKYCYSGTFNSGYSCPLFEASDGGEGNDIAVIQISGQFGDPVNYPYPRLVESSQYPTTYTMAPVLSIGYGINNQAPNSNADCGTSDQPCGTMFYVANYQYQTSNSTGYHYLYNSYYNSNSLGSGYTALICGGDSGGGDLFWTGNDWILLSEHTYGPSEACGTFYNYLPNGATNVSAYYNWIMTIMNANDPVATCRESDNNCVTNAL